MDAQAFEDRRYVLGKYPNIEITSPYLGVGYRVKWSPGEKEQIITAKTPGVFWSILRQQILYDERAGAGK